MPNPFGGLWKDLTEEQYNELTNDAKRKFHIAMAAQLERIGNRTFESNFHRRAAHDIKQGLEAPFKMEDEDPNTGHIYRRTERTKLSPDEGNTTATEDRTDVQRHIYEKREASENPFTGNTYMGSKTFTGNKPGYRGPSKKKIRKPKSIFPLLPKRGLNQYSKKWTKPKRKKGPRKQKRATSKPHWKETLQQERPANYQKISNIIHFLKTNNKQITQKNIAEELGESALSVDDMRALDYILQEK